MNIQEYDYGNNFNHNPKSERKLLLNKNELKKLEKEINSNGLTIVPTKLFLNEKGLAKLQISLARGKKLFDKREKIKDRENKINLDRLKKKLRS